MVRALRLAALACLFALALVALDGPAWAHATLTSSVALDVTAEGIDAELQLPLDQLGLALGADLADPRAVLPAFDSRLRDYVRAHFRIATAAGAGAWEARVGDLAVRTVDGAPFLIARVASRAPAGAARAPVILHDDLILHRVVTHHILVSLRRDFDQALLGDDPKVIGVLTYAQKEISIPREGSSPWRGVRAVFRLGVRHIAEGTDHLLFLFVLLLSAPLVARGGRWQGARETRPVKATLTAVLALVTAFTVGHSIALACAAFGWVTVPGRPVEIAIAASIAVTALHAFRPLFARREPALAFGFGLVHGLAFATVLQELGVKGSSLALSLLGFNLGIEAMQLAIVAMFLPWLVLLGRTRAYAPFRVVAAGAATAAAIGWIVERVSGDGNGITRAVAAIAGHPVALVTAFALTALAATLATRPGGRAAPSAGRPRDGHPDARLLAELR